MSECEWGDRESCISPRPGPACGACTEWLCVRIRELEEELAVAKADVKALRNRLDEGMSDYDKFMEEIVP